MEHHALCGSYLFSFVYVEMISRIHLGLKLSSLKTKTLLVTLSSNGIKLPECQ